MVRAGWEETRDDVERLVDQLHAARASGTPATGVPQPVGLGLSEALDAQLRVLARFLESGDQVAGWKVSFTSGQNRDRMGAGVRPFGFVLASRAFSGGAAVSLPAGGRFVLEPELCVVVGELASDDAPSRANIRRTASLAPAFEINQRRLDPAVPDDVRVVDGTGQWGIVVGPAVPVPADFDATAVRVTLRCDGAIVQQTVAPMPIDNPFDSVAGLARRLDEHGRALAIGDRVITGAYTRAQLSSGAHVWCADFEGLGSVHARLVL